MIDIKKVDVTLEFLDENERVTREPNFDSSKLKQSSMRVRNSVGSECRSYKAEVGGSNPPGPAKLDGGEA